MGRKKAKENTWRRVLWKQRDYDDSYVDETFMKDLKMNFYRSRLGYFVLVKESSCITQQLSLVILYMICFFDAMEEAVDPFTLLLLCLGIAVFLTTVSKMFVEEHKSRLMVTESISTAGLLFFVSPILRTLTEPWSDDTLTAMCLLFLVIHLASTDYSTKPRDEPIAVNAASFASVLLASRLPQYNYGFIMITLGVLLFTVSPEPRKALRTKVPEAWSAITWLLVGAAFAFLLNIDKAYAVLYCFVILSITFLIPAWLIHEHEVGKMQISGPWDEAKPTNSAAAAEWATAGLLTLLMLHKYGTSPSSNIKGHRPLRVLGDAACFHSAVECDPQWETLTKIRSGSKYLPAVRNESSVPKVRKAPQKADCRVASITKMPALPPLLCTMDSMDLDDVAPKTVKSELFEGHLHTPRFFDWLLKRKVTNLMKEETEEREQVIGIESDLVEVTILLEWMQLSIFGNENYHRNSLLSEEYWTRRLIGNMKCISAKVMNFLKLTQFKLANKYWSALRQKTKEAAEIRIGGKVAALIDQSMARTVMRLHYNRLFDYSRTQLLFKQCRRDITNQQYQSRAFIIQEELQEAVIIRNAISSLNLMLWLTHRQLAHIPFEEADGRCALDEEGVFTYEVLFTRSEVEKQWINDMSVIAASEASELEKKLDRWLFLVKGPHTCAYYYSRWVNWSKMSSLKKKSNKQLMGRYKVRLTAFTTEARKLKEHKANVARLLSKSNFLLARKAWAQVKMLLMKVIARRLMLTTDRGLVRHCWGYWRDYVKIHAADRMIATFKVQFSVNTEIYILRLYFKKFFTWHVKHQQSRRKSNYVHVKNVAKHLALRYIPLKRFTARQQFERETLNILQGIIYLAQCAQVRLAWFRWLGFITEKEEKRDKREQQRQKCSVMAETCVHRLRMRYFNIYSQWHVLLQRKVTKEQDAAEMRDRAFFLIARRYFRSLIKLRKKPVPDVTPLYAAIINAHTAMRFGCWLRLLRRRKRNDEMELMSYVLHKDMQVALLKRHWEPLLRWSTSGPLVHTRKMAERHKVALTKRYYSHLSRYQFVLEKRSLQNDQAATLCVLYSTTLMRKYWQKWAIRS